MIKSYTKESLMEIALENQVIYENLSIEFPAGTIHDGRNRARRTMEEALFCAEWMEKEGIEELANVGPFMTTQVSKGQKVKIKKGAVVFSTLPSVPRSGIRTIRDQWVTVHYSSEGHIDHGHLRRDCKTTVEQGRVTWAGTGGYWRWTDINNIMVEDSELGCEHVQDRLARVRVLEDQLRKSAVNAKLKARSRIWPASLAQKRTQHYKNDLQLLLDQEIAKRAPIDDKARRKIAAYRLEIEKWSTR